MRRSAVVSSSCTRTRDLLAELHFVSRDEVMDAVGLPRAIRWPTKRAESLSFPRASGDMLAPSIQERLTQRCA